MERRDFIRTAGAAATWTALSQSRVLGANNRLNVGLIGCGGRGSLDARLMRGNLDDLKALAPDSFLNGQPDPRLTSEPRGVEIAALCDVDQRRIDHARAWAPNAKGYSDFRKLLESKDIDAVILATPDHWHGSIAILTCEAGKDMYIEKPVMYSLREARFIREAVRRNKRIVQIGTQHRSADHIAKAAQIVQSGKIGPVYFVRVWNYRNQGNAAPSPNAPVPAGLDWEFWVGPAPSVPFNPDRCLIVHVGHSLGGGVALQFAYQFPERCERLVLVSSGGLGREVHPILRAAALPGAELVLPWLAAGAARGIGTMMKAMEKIGFRASADLGETWRSFVSLEQPEARRAFLHTVRSIIDLGGQLVSATDKLYLAKGLPTMIVWGERDPLIPVRHARPQPRAHVGQQARDLPRRRPLSVSRRSGALRDDPARFHPDDEATLVRCETAAHQPSGRPADVAARKSLPMRGCVVTGSATPAS